MYKVIIIDDEPIIVTGLKKAVKWADLDCEVVGTAANGIDGLALIKEVKPDILISDISMPGLDGLSMIAAIKSEFPYMEITILTGFRDFDYAQTAIKLGVCRFLLKPSKMDELDEAVHTMLENLKKRPAIHIEEGLKITEGETAQASDEMSEGDGEILENAASSFIVNNALKYMEMNYKEKLKLSDVADNVYVSQWHLSKLLRRHMGQSFPDILNNIRIEEAKNLLKNPALRVSDVAEAVGFLDMAHFSRVFKKQAGFSANEFRNTILK